MIFQRGPICSNGIMENLSCLAHAISSRSLPFPAMVLIFIPGSPHKALKALRVAGLTRMLCPCRNAGGFLSFQAETKSAALTWSVNSGKGAASAKIHLLEARTDGIVPKVASAWLESPLRSILPGSRMDASKESGTEASK